MTVTKDKNQHTMQDLLINEIYTLVINGKSDSRTPIKKSNINGAMVSYHTRNKCSMEIKKNHMSYN